MNLLPITEKEAIKKGLKRRFIIMTSLLLAISFWVGVIMLVPSYFLVLGNISKIEINNSSIDIKNNGEVEEMLNLPMEINSKLKFMQDVAANQSSIEIFNKVIGLVPENVFIDSITFSRNGIHKGEKGLLMSMSGQAADRNSLVLFSTSLEKSKHFSLVDVPVSSLTKDKNLPFSINIFIKN